MTPEDKVLSEIKDRINELFIKIAELKVTEDERREFEYEKSLYQVKIDDYKRHKEALAKREAEWNLSHQ
jgi:hypothetical protein